MGDERVDMKSRVSHPLAKLANALAHTAVACYWVVALVLVFSYSVHFNEIMARRWAYSCWCGWLFMWFVLELVKVALSTIVELSQLNQRRRLVDHTRLKDRVAMKREKKIKQMTSLAKAQGVPVPMFNSLLPVPPLPPEPPPGMGDASAG